MELFMYDIICSTKMSPRWGYLFNFSTFNLSTLLLLLINKLFILSKINGRTHRFVPTIDRLIDPRLLDSSSFQPLLHSNFKALIFLVTK